MTTHGMFGTPEHVAWMEMRRRCYDRRRKEYPRYGGRGIRVCRTWNHPTKGFAAFFAAMGNRPSPRHTLGRKDNDGPYCRSNCEWQTVQDQNRNRSNTRWWKHAGRTRTPKEWAAITGIPYETLCARRRRGWSIERTLTIPVT